MNKGLLINVYMCAILVCFVIIDIIWITTAGKYAQNETELAIMFAVLFFTMFWAIVNFFFALDKIVNGNKKDAEKKKQEKIVP